MIIANSQISDSKLIGQESHKATNKHFKFLSILGGVSIVATVVAISAIILKYNPGVLNKNLSSYSAKFISENLDLLSITSYSIATITWIAFFFLLKGNKEALITDSSNSPSEDGQVREGVHAADLELFDESVIKVNKDQINHSQNTPNEKLVPIDAKNELEQQNLLSNSIEIVFNTNKTDFPKETTNLFQQTDAKLKTSLTKHGQSTQTFQDQSLSESLDNSFKTTVKDVELLPETVERQLTPTQMEILKSLENYPHLHGLTTKIFKISHYSDNLASHIDRLQNIPDLNQKVLEEYNERIKKNMPLKLSRRNLPYLDRSYTIGSHKEIKQTNHETVIYYQIVAHYHKSPHPNTGIIYKYAKANDQYEGHYNVVKPTEGNPALPAMVIRTSKIESEQDYNASKEKIIKEIKGEVQVCQEELMETLKTCPQLKACCNISESFSTFSQKYGKLRERMLLLEGVSFDKIITDEKGRDSFINLKERITDIISLLEGIYWLHKNHFVHLDLKPENLLKLPKGRTQIADFDLLLKCNKKGYEIVSNYAPGTFGNQPPEVAYNQLPKKKELFEDGECYDILKKADIYSLGKCFEKMLPCSDFNCDGDNIVTRDLSLNILYPLKNFYKYMQTESYKNRPNIELAAQQLNNILKKYLRSFQKKEFRMHDDTKDFLLLMIQRLELLK